MGALIKHICQNLKTDKTYSYDLKKKRNHIGFSFIRAWYKERIFLHCIQFKDYCRICHFSTSNDSSVIRIIIIIIIIIIFFIFFFFYEKCN